MYTNVIEHISRLNWEAMHPIDLAYLSTVTGKEFAETLRLGRQQYSEDPAIVELIDDELETTNLRFEEYDQQGDHVEMLEYFFHRDGLWEQVSQHARASGARYVDYMCTLNAKERMMTLASREVHLPEVFTGIVQSHDWSELGLGFYAQYLRDHIRWDGKGGHGDLLHHISCDEDVLNAFWGKRLEMYEHLLHL